MEKERKMWILGGNCFPREGGEEESGLHMPRFFLITKLFRLFTPLSQGWG